MNDPIEDLFAPERDDERALVPTYVVHTTTGTDQPRLQPAPVDWPARFRAAAEVADANGWYLTGDALRNVSRAETHEHVFAAIGRALLGHPTP